MSKEDRKQLQANEIAAFKKMDEACDLEGNLSPAKTKTLYITDHPITEVLMMLLTVYALYGADFNNAYGDRHTDGPMGILNFMTMLIFLIELGEFVFLFSLQKYFILLILQYMNFFLNSCSCSTFLFFS